MNTIRPTSNTNTGYYKEDNPISFTNKTITMETKETTVTKTTETVEPVKEITIQKGSDIEKELPVTKEVETVTTVHPKD